jgi:hypothetical protein
MGNVTSMKTASVPPEPVVEKGISSNTLLMAGTVVAVLVAGIAVYAYFTKGK